MWLQWVGGQLVHAGRVALDLLLPPQCIVCDQLVEEPGQLCAACFRDLSFVTEPCCRRCGVPFANLGQAGHDRLCPTCHADPPGFDRARAALRYDGPARRLILPFKHGDRIEIAPTLALHMARAGTKLLAETDLLVPVPLHRKRLFHRRYNQAALLATAVSRVSGRPTLLDALQRGRPTPSLGEKSAIERAAVVDGAFAVRLSRAGFLPGRRILLIDDVMTSGATANACALKLKAAGAAAVDVLVAARVPDPRLN